MATRVYNVLDTTDTKVASASTVSDSFFRAVGYLNRTQGEFATVVQTVNGRTNKSWKIVPETV